jgi:hypothetical protein
MIDKQIQRGACAWCHEPIPEPEPYAGVLIQVGVFIEQRGPFHSPACVAHFQAARARILAEHRA